MGFVIIKSIKLMISRWRKFCGLSRVKRWSDLDGLMSNISINAYREIFDSPEDIDLWSAGITEYHLPDAIVGPTFACIMGIQFHNLR